LLSAYYKLQQPAVTQLSQLGEFEAIDFLWDLEQED